MTATQHEGWFEDFKVGEVYRHARGRTVTEMDNVLITHMVMNTADAHFNEHRMQNGDLPYKERVVFGGVVISMVVGLATQDTAEKAIAEVGMDKIRLKAPVFHGDTLYAYSEVLEVRSADRADGGIAVFRHWGVNQKQEIVFEGERTVLIKRRVTAASQ
jgi:itaconyl-CoA hydratase